METAQSASRQSRETSDSRRTDGDDDASSQLASANNNTPAALRAAGVLGS